MSTEPIASLEGYANRINEAGKEGASALDQKAFDLKSRASQAEAEVNPAKRISLERAVMQRRENFAKAVRTDVEGRYPAGERLRPHILLKALDQSGAHQPVAHQTLIELKALGLGTKTSSEIRMHLQRGVEAEKKCAELLSLAVRVKAGDVSGIVAARTHLNALLNAGDLADLLGVYGTGRLLNNYIDELRFKMREYVTKGVAQDAYSDAELVITQAQEYFKMVLANQNHSALAPPPAVQINQIVANAANPLDKLKVGTNGAATSVGQDRSLDEDVIATMNERHSIVSDLELAGYFGRINLSPALGAIDLSKMTGSDIATTYAEMRQMQADGKFGGFRVLADGMGGQGDGQIASRIGEFAARKYILEALKRGDPVEEKMLSEAILFADKTIMQWNNATRGVSGSTFVCTLTTASGETLCASVGDSRIYVRNERGEMRSLYVDQSLCSSLVIADAIKPSEVLTHPQRSTVFGGLGDKKPLTVSGMQVQRLTMNAGQELLLVCDGVWEDIDVVKYKAELAVIDTRFAQEKAQFITQGESPESATSKVYMRAMGRMMELQYAEAAELVKRDPVKYPNIAAVLAHSSRGTHSQDNVSAILLRAEIVAQPPKLAAGEVLGVGKDFDIHGAMGQVTNVRILSQDPQSGKFIVEQSLNGSKVNVFCTKDELQRMYNYSNPPKFSESGVKGMTDANDVIKYINDMELQGHKMWPMPDRSYLSAKEVCFRISSVTAMMTDRAIQTILPTFFQSAGFAIRNQLHALKTARKIILQSP